MKRILGRTKWLAAFALAYCFAAGASAAENPLDARANIALRDAGLDETFRTFAKLLSAEVEVSPALKGKVTVELHNVRVRTLLDVVCEGIGCRWQLLPGNPPKLRVWPLPPDKPAAAAKAPVRETMEQHIDFRVTAADVRDVLKTFGEILDGTTEVDPAITGTVTFDLSDVPCREVLDKICQTVGCTWEVADGPPRVLKVTAKGKK
ncbi:MAG TPA: hypothetical protein VF173_14870 [Thermoanaerobaculia bacterium]|nr:hypothetical protein [Thermoanaerobaculia bacterium]